MKIFNSSGQTLLEVLVALSTAVVIVSSITSAVISSLSNAEFERNQIQATSYAGQGLEILRSLRSSDYATFQQLSNSYCLAKSCTTVSTVQGDPCGPMGLSCGQNVDSFVRQIQITQNAPDCQNVATKVTSTVSWADGKCTDKKNNPFCHSEIISSCLSNFGMVVIPAPQPTGPTPTNTPVPPTPTNTPVPPTNTPIPPTPTNTPIPPTPTNTPVPPMPTPAYICANNDNCSYSNDCSSYPNGKVCYCYCSSSGGYNKKYTCQSKAWTWVSDTTTLFCSTAHHCNSSTCT